MPCEPSVDRLRLVGVSGTNKVMAGELSRLAAHASLPDKLPAPKKDGLGALLYPFIPALAVLAVGHHRTSIRVLWDLYESNAARLEPLYEDLRDGIEHDPRPWLADGLGISVDARRMDDFAAGERQIVGTVKNALIDGAAARGLRLHVNPDRPDLLFDVRLRDGAVGVSIDLAGRPMHHRGYRRTGGVAPLKENLAAVLVMLGRHQAREEPLIDPMCGSGTIAIEAAAMGRGAPVWVPPRRPACSALENLRKPTHQSHEPLFPDTRPVVIANDLEHGAFRACEAHVAHAGVKASVSCVHGDFRDLDTATVFARCKERRCSAKRGLILTNPPYGQRLSTPELAQLYRDLGRWCRKFHGWRAAFLVANDDFERAFGGRPRIKKPLTNGRIRSTFLLYDL